MHHHHHISLHDSPPLQDALLTEAVNLYGNDWVKVRATMGDGATSDRSDDGHGAHGGDDTDDHHILYHNLDHHYHCF